MKLHYKEIGVVIISIFIILATAIGSLAETYITSEHKDGLNVSWYDRVDKASYKEYRINFNTDSGNKMFNARAEITGNLESAEIMLKRKDTYSEEVNNLINTYCVDSEVYNTTTFINDTVTQCYGNFSTYYVDRTVYTNVSSINNGYDNGTIYYDFGLLNVSNSDYLLSMKNPDKIIYNVSIGLRNLLTNEYYHPVSNSSFYASDFTNDVNSTTCNIINGTITNIFPLDIIAFYDMESNTGGLIDDDLTGSYDLQRNGVCVLETTGGISGSYLNWSCTSGAASFSSGINYNFDTSFTVNIWIYPETLQNSVIWELACPSCTGGLNSNFVEFQTLVGGNLFGRAFHNGVSLTPAAINVPSYDVNSWQMITFIYNGGNNLTLWKNASLIGSQALNNTDLDIFPDVYTGYFHQNNQYWNGGLDELSVYDEVLGQEALTELYNFGMSKFVENSTVTSCIYNSNTFETGENNTNFTAFTDCGNNCFLNLTAEGILYSSLTNGQSNQTNVSDSSLTFDYVIKLFDNDTTGGLIDETSGFSLNDIFNTNAQEGGRIEFTENLIWTHISVVQNQVSGADRCFIYEDDTGTKVREVTGITQQSGSIKYPLNESLNVNANERFVIECRLSTSGNTQNTRDSSPQPTYPKTSNRTIYLNGTINQGNNVSYWAYISGVTTVVSVAADQISTSYFNLTFGEPIIPVVNVTPTNFTYQCLTLSDTCIDGKFECLLAVNTVTGDEISGKSFDQPCSSINIGSVGFRLFFFGLALALIFLGLRFKKPVLTAMGGFVGMIFSFGIAYQYTLIGILLGIVFLGFLIIAVFETK